MLRVLLYQFVEIDPAEFLAVSGVLGSPNDGSMGYLQAADHLAVTFHFDLKASLQRLHLDDAVIQPAG